MSNMARHQAILRRLEILESHLTHATEQLNLQDNKMSYLQVRYSRAYRDKNMTYRYTLSIQILTIKDMIAMFEDFIQSIEDKMHDLQEQLEASGIITISLRG